MRQSERTRGWCVACLGAASLSLAGCGGEHGGAADSWDGTVDTLPNGAIEVHNSARGTWDSTSAWRVTEEVRIGSLEGSGPDLFGQISALEVDEAGRFYVFESQVQELRVFDSSGSYVRTIGREGRGPGEFRLAIGLAWAPNGLLWVVDPGNSRISVFDTSGTYVGMKRILGGYIMMPWKGRFDRAGLFYHFGLDVTSEVNDRFVMVRFDTLLNSIDTLSIPNVQQSEYFDLRTEDGVMRAGVPFTAEISWTISPSGRLWFANTDAYRIFEREVGGDTVLIINREYDRIPVTGAEIDSAVAELDWFTRQGGRVDRSRFPSFKPALGSLFVDGEGNVWVAPVVRGSDGATLLDVFDLSGRYLGRVRLPFVLDTGTVPLFRNGCIYGVTTDELNVPYVVRGRIEKP